MGVAAGNLYATLLLASRAPPDHARRNCRFVAGVGRCTTRSPRLRARAAPDTGAEMAERSPLGGAKLAGILIEAESIEAEGWPS